MSESPVLFRLSYLIDKPKISEPNKFTLQILARSSFSFLFRESTPEERGDQTPTDSWVLETTLARVPPRAVNDGFQKIVSWTKVSEGVLNVYVEDMTVFEEVKKYYETAIDEVTTAAQRALRIFRWRLGLRGNNSQVIRSLESSFSTDNSLWLPLPTKSYLIFDIFSTPKVDSTAIDQLNVVLSSDIDEPRAHALWREAWESRRQNEASAILLAAGALEIGLKSCVSRIKPDCQWLLDNLAAPPVERLLREYLPTLYKDGGEHFAIPSSALELVRKLVQIRNRLAHTGALNVDEKFIDDALRIVRNFLWLFDIIVGHDWARTYFDRTFDPKFGLPQEVAN